MCSGRGIASANSIPKSDGRIRALPRSAELRFGKARRESPVHADSEIGAPFTAILHWGSVKMRPSDPAAIAIIVVKPAAHLFDQNRYPERFAQEALGHNSKAVHRAYAKRALMKLPSLEEYEKRAA